MPTLIRIMEDGLLCRRAMAKQFYPEMRKGQGEFDIRGFDILRLFTHPDLLTGPERKLRNRLSSHVAFLPDCFVIITDTDPSSDDMAAHLAHAVYWADANYRMTVSTLLESNKDILVDYIEKLDGNDDDIQAYLVSQVDKLPPDLYSLSDALRHQLIRGFEMHFERSLIDR
jgi:hypothetical protein